MQTLVWFKMCKFFILFYFTINSTPYVLVLLLLCCVVFLFCGWVFAAVVRFAVCGLLLEIFICVLWILCGLNAGSLCFPCRYCTFLCFTVLINKKNCSSKIKKLKTWVYAIKVLARSGNLKLEKREDRLQSERRGK
jgi:hypothetical protein